MVLDFTLEPTSLSTDFVMPKLWAVQTFIGPGPLPSL